MNELKYFHTINSGIPFEMMSDKNIQLIRGKYIVAITTLSNSLNYPNCKFWELTYEDQISLDIWGLVD